MTKSRPAFCDACTVEVMPDGNFGVGPKVDSDDARSTQRLNVGAESSEFEARPVGVDGEVWPERAVAD